MIERYRDPEINGIFDDENRYATWRLVEITIARRQEEPSVDDRHRIPHGTTDALAQASFVKVIQQIPEIERDTHHDFVAFLQSWRGVLRENGEADAARWLHYGLTSSDVQDTAFALQLRQALRHLLHLQNKTAAVILEKENKRGATPRIGRTHGQHAAPMNLYDLLERWTGHLTRAGRAVEEAARLESKASGPVGTFDAIPEEINMELAERFELEPSLQRMQCVPRDQLALLANAVSGLVTACNQVALDFRLLAITEIGEVREGFGEKQRGSSSIPHKRNPITAEKLAGMARLARGYASMLQPWELWLERDISHSSVERVAWPDLFHVACHAVFELGRLISNAEFDTHRMRRNVRDANAINSATELLDAVQKGEDRDKAEARIDRQVHGQDPHHNHD